MVLPLLLLLLSWTSQSNGQSSCNCFDCKTITEGPHVGNYYTMGTSGSTGGCLYREKDNGKIIRACDSEFGTMYEYHKCFDTQGLQVCREPPEYEPYGYDSRTWDGARVLQTSFVRYTCLEPKKVVGYNGSANYDIWCSASDFPNWQFSLPGNALPLCQLPADTEG